MSDPAEGDEDLVTEQGVNEGVQEMEGDAPAEDAGEEGLQDPPGGREPSGS